MPGNSMVYLLAIDLKSNPPCFTSGQYSPLCVAQTVQLNASANPMLPALAGQKLIAEENLI